MRKNLPKIIFKDKNIKEQKYIKKTIKKNIITNISKNNISLRQIFDKYGTDKGFRHSYEHIYEYLLKPFISKSCTLLEFGVLGGASIRSWEEYLPFAKIIGVDKGQVKNNFSQRVIIKQGKMQDVNFLKTLIETYNNFDIIIDDASHKCRDSKIAFEILFPYINKGGLYIIEDINTDKEMVKWLIELTSKECSYEHKNKPHSYWTIFAGELVAFKKL